MRNKFTKLFIACFLLLGAFSASSSTIVATNNNGDQKGLLSLYDWLWGRNYTVNEVKYVSGLWQARSNDLAPIGFDWGDNGIPLSAIDFTDSNGNLTASQAYNGTQKYLQINRDANTRSGTCGNNLGRRWCPINHSIYTYWIVEIG